MKSRLDRLCAGTSWSHDGHQLRIPLPNGRSQSFVLEPFKEGGLACLRVFTVIGPAQGLDAMRLKGALRLNWQLRHGALGVGLVPGDEEEKLVLVDLMTETEATDPALRSALPQLAATADRYEQLVFGTDNH